MHVTADIEPAFHPKLYLRGSMDKLKDRARMRWSRLTESEINDIESNRAGFFDHVKRKYGLPLYETEQKIMQWERENATVAA